LKRTIAQLILYIIVILEASKSTENDKKTKNILSTRQHI